MEINYFFLDTKEIHLDKKSLSKRFERIAFFQGYHLDYINFIFVSDRIILSTNRKFLKHNYTTDVITFDYCIKKIIQGDVYISLDTVRVNCKRFKTAFKMELLRVMVHGLLHLCTLNDKSELEKERMKKAEDLYLRLFHEERNI